MTTKSSSQLGQDVFVKEILLSAKAYKGYFIDIGCGHPVTNNNTYNFERVYGWTGLLVDDSKKYEEDIKMCRTSPFICDDIYKMNWHTYLQAFNFPNEIDYISIDLGKNTVNAVINFPFDNVRAKIITLQHDFYKHGSYQRDRMRAFLFDKGYKLICGNVKFEGNAYEDWFVHYTYEFTAGKFRCNDKEYIDIFKDVLKIDEKKEEPPNPIPEPKPIPKPSFNRAPTVSEIIKKALTPNRIFSENSEIAPNPTYRKIRGLSEVKVDTTQSQKPSLNRTATISDIIKDALRPKPLTRTSSVI